MMLYISAISATKISILLFYSESLHLWPLPKVCADILVEVRVFPPTVSTRFRMLCFAAIALLSVQIAVFVLLVAFECTPISFNWTMWDGQHQ